MGLHGRGEEKERWAMKGKNEKGKGFPWERRGKIGCHVKGEDRKMGCQSWERRRTGGHGLAQGGEIFLKKKKTKILVFNEPIREGHVS